MKEKFEFLTKALLKPETKASLLAFAKRYVPTYEGKKILGHDFLVTKGSLVGAAFECGENTVAKFFDGDNAVVNGKTVSEWLAAYAPFAIQEDTPTK